MSPERDADPGGKREAILGAALVLFAERGFHGTAVPLVAERAGVGAGTVYRYFESKEALVNALFQEWKAALGRALLQDFPATAPPRQQFHVFWHKLCRFGLEHPLALAFLELHHHAPYLDERSRAMDEAVLGPARALIEAAQQQLAVKPLAADLLIAVVHGIFIGVVKAARQGLLALDAETLDRAEECAWEAVRR